MVDENKDEILIKNMRQSLDSLENMPVKTPDMGYFRKLVAEAEGKKKEKRKKETLVFILSAIAVLSLETYAFNQSTAYFVALQLTVLVSLPAALLAMFRRKKGQEGVK